MRRHHFLAVVAVVFPLAAPPPAGADIVTVARCQKRIANAGANFAKRVINATLKCTNAVAECQVQCEQGVFGPPCDDPPVPPCCDVDDRTSNSAYDACMDEADEECAHQTVKIADYEATKQQKMIDGCTALTQEELCGATGNGLNFATLNAGCLALDPTYTCNITNLIGCMGGPLERRLVDQISATLDPRAGDAVATLNLQSAFPDIPVTRKVKEDVPADKIDLWSITGQAGDELKVRVRTRNDNGNGTANLRPELVVLGNDQSTPVADTNIRSEPCGVPNVCGSSCPTVSRVLPFNGTFYLAVRAVAQGGCTGGKYRLVVTSPGGTVPTLVADDVDPPTP